MLLRLQHFRSRTQHGSLAVPSALWSDKEQGHWSRSPEWFGTQAGGWGQGPGDVVFSKASSYGNGQVEVTAHAAAPLRNQQRMEEWRVLRFNGSTHQSVARVHIPAHASTADSSPLDLSDEDCDVRAKDSQVIRPGVGPVVADPRCLAMEYTKTMAAAVSAVVGMAGLQHWVRSQATLGTTGGCCVCYGMGGGSLPLFLAHHFPQMKVQAVDLDPVVVQAATDAMGFVSRHNLEAIIADAADHVAQLPAGQADVVLIDLFDAQNHVPAFLASSSFLTDLSRALHPSHGSVIVNLHGGGLGGLSLRRLLKSLKGGATGFTEETPQGRAVRNTAAAYKASLLTDASGSGRTRGLAYTVSTASQHNIILVATRAVKPGSPSGLQHYETLSRIQGSAEAVASAAGYVFETGQRASRNFAPL